MLVAIAVKYFAESPSVQRIVYEEGDLKVDSVSLDAMVFIKKTGTLLKRSASLRISRKWFETTDFAATEFFSEAAVFHNVLALNADHAPATRAAVFREAVNFSRSPSA